MRGIGLGLTRSINDGKRIDAVTKSSAEYVSRRSWTEGAMASEGNSLLGTVSTQFNNSTFEKHVDEDEGRWQKVAAVKLDRKRLVRL